MKRRATPAQMRDAIRDVGELGYAKSARKHHVSRQGLYNRLRKDGKAAGAWLDAKRAETKMEAAAREVSVSDIAEPWYEGVIRRALLDFALLRQENEKLRWMLVDALLKIHNLQPAQTAANCAATQPPSAQG